MFDDLKSSGLPHSDIKIYLQEAYVTVQASIKQIHKLLPAIRFLATGVRVPWPASSVRGKHHVLSTKGAIP